MNGFEIVAIVLVAFLAFGIVVGALIVSVLAHRKASRPLAADRRPPPVPPNDDGEP